MKAEDRIISRLFFQLLPVQILLVAVGSINSLIDGAMAGSYIGGTAMAMIGLYTPAIKIIETISTVFMSGSQILCCRFLGKNQMERTQSVFSLNLLMVMIFAVLLTLISLLIPGVAAGVLGADAQTRAGLTEYIFGLGFGLVPQFLTTQLTAFLQIEQQQKRTYIGIGTMAAVNIALDYLFIVVLEMGMLGLGLATALSYWALFLVLGSYYLTGKAQISFRLQSVRSSDLGPIVKTGLPGAVVIFCLAVRGVVLNLLLLRYAGNDGVGALSALNTCGGMLYAVTAGIASATRLLSSVYIGEEDRAGLVMVIKTALFKGVAMVCAVALAVLLLARPITGIFFKDPSSNVYQLCVWLFRIYPFCMPLSAICVIFINYFQSASRMHIVHVLSVMDGAAGLVLSSLVLGPVLGAIGIWIAHVLNGVYTTIAIIVHAYVVNRKMPRSVEDLMTIAPSFGVEADQRLDLTIHSAEEVADTSVRIMEFCERVGIDRKRAVYAGLCMEEMAVNIIKHGFSDSRTHTVDVRVVNKSEGLLLRIKDDCRAFNPKEKLELIDPGDATHNIGLRMVHRLAKDMSYSNVLGLNVLTFTI